MASVTQGASRFYYRGDAVVYPYDEGTPSARYVREYVANREGYPVAQPRLAATVMLVREGDAPGAQQTFMLHRVPTMDFAADAYVFPGGRVDEFDACQGIAWEGPAPAQWAACMGVGEHVARCVAVAAVRELYEECGVLLASGPDGAVGVAADDRAAEERRALAAHQATLSQVLAARGMALRTDLLSVLSRWITPVAEPRRYDTFFFAAMLPPGAVADGNTSEASDARWVDPAVILQRFREDRTLLLPPTIHHLLKLRQAPSARAFCASNPQVSPVLCESAVLDGEAVAVCPRA